MTNPNHPSVDQSDRVVPVNLRQSGRTPTELLISTRVRKSPFWHLSHEAGCWRATVYNRTAAGTKNNTQLWMQISHAGRQTPGEINSSPLAPSNIGLKIPGKNYGTPTPMTEEDILDVIDRFVFT